MQHTTNLSTLTSVLAFGLGALLLVVPAFGDEAESDLEGEITFGVQATSVDAVEDRDGKFKTFRDEPSGFVLDSFQLAVTSGKRYFYVQGKDPLQDDERYLLRTGVAGKVGIRFSYADIPFFYGSNGKLPLDRLAPNEFRIPDFVQRQLEDPDGNGIPFYSEPGGVDGDNLLVQSLMNQYLAGREPFDLGTSRQSGDLEITLFPANAWTVRLASARTRKSGSRPLGKGTYQRIRNGYDYHFSVRGLELPAPAESTTDRFSVSASYRQPKWFGNLDASYSRFDNEYSRLVYDNPFWFTDTNGASGIRRGLWEEGDAALFPDNEAWNISLSGGASLPANTRVTVLASLGEHTQNQLFLPISTNSALIGSFDLNGDGVVDASDNPTLTSALSRSSLNAKSDVEVLSFRIVSRPVERLKLMARFYSYEYDGNDRPFEVPARADYNNSRLRDNFHSADLIYIPFDFKKQTLEAEGVVSLTSDLKLSLFAKTVSRDYPQYTDFDGGDFDRDAGVRAVEGTDEDLLGATLAWNAGGKVSGRLTWKSSDRNFVGDYQVAFDGEFEEIRQFDIADREREALEAALDFVVDDRWTLGFEYRMVDDTYPQSVYGLLDDEEQGGTVHIGLAATSQASFYAYADFAESDARTHLRTKCSNCPPPPGGPGSTPWEVLNYDWFTTYDEQTVSFGLGADIRSKDGTNQVEIEAGYYAGTIEQTTRNPDIPRDLLAPGQPPVGVALGFDFPDQENTLTTVELRYTRKLGERLSVGFFYLYEDFDLDDFQLDLLDPYGPNTLSVDDATRWLFLDARIGDYTAHVGQAFLSVKF